MFALAFLGGAKGAKADCWEEVDIFGNPYFVCDKPPKPPRTDPKPNPTDPPTTVPETAPATTPTTVLEPTTTKASTTSVPKPTTTVVLNTDNEGNPTTTVYLGGLGDGGQSGSIEDRITLSDALGVGLPIGLVIGGIGVAIALARRHDGTPTSDAGKFVPHG